MAPDSATAYARRRAASVAISPQPTSTSATAAGIPVADPVPGNVHESGGSMGTSSIGASESTVVVVDSDVVVVTDGAVVDVPPGAVVVVPGDVVTGTVVAGVVVTGEVVVGTVVGGGDGLTRTTLESVDPFPGSTRSIFQRVARALTTCSQNAPLLFVVTTNGPTRSPVFMSVAYAVISMFGG